MSDPIRVVVCAGTTCYVMGGAELLDIEARLPEALAGRIKLEGATCLGHCHDRKRGGPPFVEIDGEALDGVTVDGLAEEIRRRLEAKTAGDAGAAPSPGTREGR